MFLKFVPYDAGEGEWRRGTRIMEVNEELDYDIRYPLDHKTLDKILVESEVNSYRGWQVVWSLPGIAGGPEWPKEGISLIKVDYRIKDAITAGFQNKTLYAYDCVMYVMSDSGKTVDKIR